MSNLTASKQTFTSNNAERFTVIYETKGCKSFRAQKEIDENVFVVGLLETTRGKNGTGSGKSANLHGQYRRKYTKISELKGELRMRLSLVRTYEGSVSSRK